MAEKAGNTKIKTALETHLKGAAKHTSNLKKVFGDLHILPPHKSKKNPNKS